MDQDLKAKWVAALRSGKYEQGKWALNSNNKFCCLGVLCDISPDVHPVGEVKGDVIYKYANNEQVSYLPPAFGDNIGLDYEAEETLSRMNDRGNSFSEIADYIEQNL